MVAEAASDALFNRRWFPRDTFEGIAIVQVDREDDKGAVETIKLIDDDRDRSPASYRAFQRRCLSLSRRRPPKGL